jgi:heterodisulfide reductase subunit B
MQFHQVDVEPLLDKLGVEYDPKAKYLGRDGKYIGEPKPVAVNCESERYIYEMKENLERW